MIKIFYDSSLWAEEHLADYIDRLYDRDGLKVVSIKKISGWFAFTKVWELKIENEKEQL